MASGSETRIRPHVLHVRVSGDERDIIRADADAAGLTVGSFVRGVVIGHPTPRAVRRPPLGRVLTGEILARLGTMNDELRATQRAIATAQPAPGKDQAVEFLEKIADTVETIRDALLQALGRRL